MQDTCPRVQEPPRTGRLAWPGRRAKGRKAWPAAQGPWRWRWLRPFGESGQARGPTAGRKATNFVLIKNITRK